MSLVDGLSQHTWEGETLYAYKLSESEYIGLVSLPYGTVQDITEFANVTEDDKGNTIKVNAVLNCHYFDMAGGTNGFLGRCQSFTYDGRTLGPDDDGFEGYNGGTDKSYTDLVILNDGTIKYGDFNSWEYPKSEVILGCAPAGVELDNGEDKDWYSPAVGYSKITAANTQSLLIKCDDGRFALVAVSGSLSPLTCRDWTVSVGGVHQSCYDSGGSTQLVVNDEAIVYTGRAIPTAFVAYSIIEEADSGDDGTGGESGDSGDTGDATDPDTGEDSGETGGDDSGETTDPETPTDPDTGNTEEEFIKPENIGGWIMAISDELTRYAENAAAMEAVKQDFKERFTNAGVDMTDIAFTAYPSKISDLGEKPVILYENGVWHSDVSVTTKTNVTEGTDNVKIGNAVTEGALMFSIPNGYVGKKVNFEFTIPKASYETTGTYAYWLSTGYLTMFRTYNSASEVLTYMNVLSISSVGETSKRTIAMNLTEDSMKVGIQANALTYVILTKVWIEGDCELPGDLDVGASWSGTFSYSDDYYGGSNSTYRYQVTNLTSGATSGTGIAKTGDTIVLSERAQELNLTGALRSGCEQVDGAATYALMYLEDVFTGDIYCTTNTVSWLGNTDYADPMTMTGTSKNVPAGTYKIMLMLTFAGNGNDTLWCGSYDAKWENISVEVAA